jgi:hypothetical protein
MNETTITRAVSDMDAQGVVLQARTLADQYGAHEAQKSLLLVRLARLHQRASQDRTVLEVAQCSTMAEFEKKVLRQAHSSVGVVSSFFTHYPEASEDTAVRLGFNVVRVLAHYAKGRGLSENQRLEALACAEEADNAGHLRRKLENTPSVGAGELTPARITLEGKEVDVNEFKSLTGDPDAKRHFDTEDPLLMANRALQETASEWGRE